MMMQFVVVGGKLYWKRPIYDGSLGYYSPLLIKNVGL